MNASSVIDKKSKFSWQLNGGNTPNLPTQWSYVTIIETGNTFSCGF